MIGGALEFAVVVLRVGESKTQAGTGRAVPLNHKAGATLMLRASLFEDRQPSHHVFPAVRVGIAGDKREVRVYDMDPTTPVSSWKTAWRSAKQTAGLTARFHDLRHTAVTRLLERGVPLSVVVSIMGWSASTMTKMAKRYAHFTLDSQRQAVERLDSLTPAEAGPGTQTKRPH